MNEFPGAVPQEPSWLWIVVGLLFGGLRRRACGMICLLHRTPPNRTSAQTGRKDLQRKDAGSAEGLHPSSDDLVTSCYYSSFLFLIVRPGAPSSVLAPSSDALCY